MRFKRLYHMIRISIMSNGYKRADYLKKKKIFADQGKNCSYTSRNIPQEAKLVKLHNNVVIGSEVLLITHDTVYKTLNRMNPAGNYRLELGPIEIGDNVYIGSRSIILPNVKIASNVIVGAGSVVTSDVPSGSIVAGAPARKVSTLNTILEKRKNILAEVPRKEERFQETWAEFYKQRNEDR